MAPRAPRAAIGFAAASLWAGFIGAAAERVVLRREAVPSALNMHLRGIFHVPEAAGVDKGAAATAVFEEMAVHETGPQDSCQQMTAALVPAGAVGSLGADGVWCERHEDGHVEFAIASGLGHVRLDLAPGAAPQRLDAGLHAGVWALVLANCVRGQARDACQVSGSVATVRPSWQRFLGGDLDASIAIHAAALVVNAMLLLSYRRQAFRIRGASITNLVAWTACAGCIVAIGNLAQLWCGSVHGENCKVLLAIVEFFTAIRIVVVASILLWVSEGCPPRDMPTDHRAELLGLVSASWTHHVLSLQRKVGPSRGLIFSGTAMLLAGLCLFVVVCRNLLRLRAPVGDAALEADEKDAAAREEIERVRRRVPPTFALVVAIAAGCAGAIAAHLLGDPTDFGTILWARRAVSQILLPEALCVGGVLALAKLWAGPEHSMSTQSMPDPLLQV